MEKEQIETEIDLVYSRRNYLDRGLGLEYVLVTTSSGVFPRFERVFNGNDYIPAALDPNYEVFVGVLDGKVGNEVLLLDAHSLTLSNEVAEGVNLFQIANTGDTYGILKKSQQIERLILCDVTKIIVVSLEAQDRIEAFPVSDSIGLSKEREDDISKT